jgi:hypothetical protein
MTMSMRGDEVQSDLLELLPHEDGEICLGDEGLFTRVSKVHLKIWMEEDLQR